MGCMILRRQGRDADEVGRKLLPHYLGFTRPDTAHRRFQLAVKLLVDDETVNDELARLTRALKGQPGRRPKPWCDLLFAGPPKWREMSTQNGWAYWRVEKWAAAVENCIRELMPHSHIRTAALHLDETSPHIHALLVPVGSDGKLGWASVTRDLAARYGLDARNQSALIMSRLQDDVWERCGQPFGLDRGKVGSKRNHRAVDRIQAAKELEQELTDKKRIQTQVDAEMGTRWSRKGRAQRRENAELKAQNAKLKADLAQAEIRLAGQEPENRAYQQKEFDRRKKHWAA